MSLLPSFKPDQTNQPRSINFGVCVGEVGAGGEQACFLGKAHEEGDHFLVALVRPAAGLVAGRLGGAEVNLVARTSAPFAAADTARETHPA